MFGGGLSLFKFGLVLLYSVFKFKNFAIRDEPHTQTNELYLNYREREVLNATEIGFDFAYTLALFGAAGYEDITQQIDMTYAIPIANMLTIDVATNQFNSDYHTIQPCKNMLKLEGYQVFPNVKEAERTQKLSTANCVDTRGQQFWGDLTEGNFFQFNLFKCTPERVSYFGLGVTCKTDAEIKDKMDGVIISSFGAQSFLDLDDYDHPVQTLIEKIDGSWTSLQYN